MGISKGISKFDNYQLYHQILGKMKVLQVTLNTLIALFQG